MRKAHWDLRFYKITRWSFQMNNWFSVALIRKAVLINVTHSFFSIRLLIWIINMTGEKNVVVYY